MCGRGSRRLGVFRRRSLTWRVSFFGISRAVQRRTRHAAHADPQVGGMGRNRSLGASNGVEPIVTHAQARSALAPLPLRSRSAPAPLPLRARRATRTAGAASCVAALVGLGRAAFRRSFSSLTAHRGPICVVLITAHSGPDSRAACYVACCALPSRPVVVSGFIGFYRALSGFIRFYPVLSGFIRFYPVVSGFIRLRWVLPRFGGLSWAFVGLGGI